MNIPPEVIAAINATFENAKYPKTVKTRPCRIKFNGEFITTSSKKTVWRNKGFAKSALLNHLRTRDIAIVVNKYILNKKGSDRDLCYFGSDFELKYLREELENLGIIEYVEVDLEDFAVQKK
jgi:hypothetical protein